MAFEAPRLFGIANNLLRHHHHDEERRRAEPITAYDANGRVVGRATAGSG